MVPRDGVEPPTPAFSGLESPEVNALIQSILAWFYSPFLARLLEA
jgi:hypothetical protein